MSDENLEEIFEPGGLVSRMLDNYEFRRPQLDMAHRVEDALKSRKPLAIEAGTGTGKTLSYLIPALRSKKRIIISTATKALQSQLVNRDLPLLEDYWPEPLSFVQLKGRRNYLCRLRYHEVSQGRGFESKQQVRDWSRIQNWAPRTETGDRAELKDVPESASIWSRITTGSSGCLGRDCTYYDDCYVYQARERAQDADIVVVNHHLFFANLSLQAEGVAGLLPEYDAVIFDEAHHIDDVATSHFSLSISPYRVKRIRSDIEKFFEHSDVSTSRLDGLLEQATDDSESFFTLLEEQLSETGRYELDKVLDGIEYAAWQEKKESLRGTLSSLGQKITEIDGLGESAVRLSERCTEIAQQLNWMLRAGDPKYAFLIDYRETGVFVEAAPIDVASILRRELLEKHDSLIFTSATLSTQRGFEFFKRQLGLSRDDTNQTLRSEFEAVSLPQVFDYEQQSCLYVPESFPEPSNPEFAERFVDQLESMVDIFGGRTFALFTSHRNLDRIHYLAESRLDYPILKQGEAPKDQLLDDFRDERQSVLFATRSFWEGVDVEGDALQLVVIDKLPFANPSDPLTSARLDYIDDAGGSSFSDYSLPSAALSLKQGFGRLIRSRSDTGVVAVFDVRLRNRRYGSYFLDSLPDLPVVGHLDELREYWRQN
jgi:ATP-dependent DNA helicase DinG